MSTDMRDDELDKLLDGALSAYSGEEPRPGLEVRVMNRVRGERHVHRFAWLTWAIAIPLLVCVLAITLLLRTKRDSTPRVPRAAPVIAKIIPAPPVRRTVIPASVYKSGRKRVPLLPRREQFPTPTPLTDEERALLAVVAGAPSAQEALVDREKDTFEPLQIAEIQIQPLQHAGGD